ncbi:MAG: HD domain-containing protein [Lachnospiraceae bacterium]|nr:HD domain-containing protein [Lachnospiraceae bacterium]
MKVDRQKIIEEFGNYTSDYDISDPKIKLKVDHTYRVASLCERIAKSIGLEGMDLDLAWCCGMLHDIGRFEQLRRYNTFMDSQSIDHAQFGVELLFGEERLIDRFFDNLEDEEFFNILHDAIYYHSAYRLPEDMEGRLLMFSDILRDADKVDIFRVNVETPLEDIYNVTTSELVESKISDGVMDAIAAEHAVLRDLKHTPIDNVAGHMALFFELIYPYSMEVAREQGYYDKLLNFQSNNFETNKQIKQIREIVNKFYEKSRKKSRQAI